MLQFAAMDELDDLDELLDHLIRTTRLDRSEAERIVADVLEFFSESTEAFVTRRHTELQGRRLANPAIFDRIGRELDTRRFRAPALSTRQIRRLIYG